MKKWWIVLLLVGLMAAGCSGWRKKTYILTETQQYYFIPAGTPFHAVMVKGQKPVEVIRDQPTWAVDAGYLMKLQKEANRRALEIPE